MSLDYQKLKSKQQEDGSFWTSYSDLFMVLSVVFLLLYVVGSLRSGTSSVQSQIEHQKLKAEAQDYKKQIQAYNALKDDYLEKEASADEAKMYDELMSKLSLLQEEATEEKKQLEVRAGENEAKAKALNQYQQMVRNIVNTSLLSNKKIKFRNEVIVKKNDEIKDMDSTIQTQTKDITEKAQLIVQNRQQIEKQEKEIYEKQQVLDQKKQQVAMLESQVNEKAQTIQTNQSKINSLNSDLSQKIKELEKTSTSANTSKAELNRNIAIMKLQNAKKIGELQNQTKEMKESVESINRELADAAGQLNDARGKMAAQEAMKKKLESDMANASAEHQAKMAQMRGDFDKKMNAEREALENQLNNEKASGAEKLKRLGEFKNKLASDKAALDKQLAGLKDEVGKAKGEADTLKGQLANAQKEHGRYMAAIGQLEKDKAGLSGDLKRAQELIEAKKKLARKIADNLAKNGIKAGVDGKTGDVTIQFGDEYFDTGKADLKENMKSVLQKFVPTYSKSLLEDEKVAKEISSVEIIGFSSPTYKGRYVDPQSLQDQDRAAVSYNLDLSYNRAKSIFSYMFDKKSMTYQHQKDLLPLVKVTGRSFLAEEVKGRDIASGLAIKDYCAKYNCEKSQKVIIRFNLKD
jgi:chromosome segregation ATPase